jgi:small subunit ribosomal protein S20
MPVTKTAKRALRGSTKKASVNAVIIKNLEVAIRVARKGKSIEKIRKAVSLADRAAKKSVIHKNKAANIKKALAKLQTKEAPKTAKKVKVVKKTSKK